MARLSVERFGDVVRLRLSSVGTRAVGLDVSAYVVRGVMIDTGYYRARAVLLDAVRAFAVRGVIVTHWHEDHAGNAAALARLGLPLSMRAETEAILRGGVVLQLYRRLVWGEPPSLEQALLAFEAPGLSTLHTPGHSSEHQVVWDEETGTLFSGDLWLGVRSRVLHATEDPYEIVESLRRVAVLSPSRMFDAHRGLVERPAEAIAAKIDWMSATMHEIERRIVEGWTDRAIVARVLGGEEKSAYVSVGDYSRRNLVRAVRRRVSSGR